MRGERTLISGEKSKAGWGEVRVGVKEVSKVEATLQEAPNKLACWLATLHYCHFALMLFVLMSIRTDVTQPPTDISLNKLVFEC